MARQYLTIKEKNKKYKNILSRNLKSNKPNQKWVIDISYIKTTQEMLYLSIIKDLHDNFIVAWKWAQFKIMH